MPEQNDIDRVWDIIEKHSVGMLTTQFAGGLRARPWTRGPTARPARSSSSPTCTATRTTRSRHSRTSASSSIVPKDNVYLSITGRASVTRDPAKAKRNLEEDRRHVVEGRAGRSQRPRAQDRAGHRRALGRPSSSLVAAYEFAKARITGEKPFLGENRKKTVPMG